MGACTVDIRMHKSHFIRTVIYIQIKCRRTDVHQDHDTSFVGAYTVDMHAHKSHFIRNLQVKSIKTPPSTCELRPRHRICGRLRSRHAHAQEPLFTEIYRRKAAEQLSTKTPRQTLREPAHSTCTRTRATLYGIFTGKMPMTIKKRHKRRKKNGTSERLTCLTRVSQNSVLQDRAARVSCHCSQVAKKTKNVLQECPTRVSLRSVPAEESLVRLSCESVRMPYKRALHVGQDCVSGASQCVLPQRPRRLPLKACVECPMAPIAINMLFFQSRLPSVMGF